jgi:hypothetical protein
LTLKMKEIYSSKIMSDFHWNIQHTPQDGTLHRQAIHLT